MARSVPLSRFTSRVGGGSAFFVRHQGDAGFWAVVLRKSFWFEIAADGLVGLKKRLALVFSRKHLVANWFASL